VAEFPQDSVKVSLDRLQQGDPTAANVIWQAYFQRLARIADQRLAAGLRRTVDGEDVALSVIQTICRRATGGQLADLGDRDDLWRLMVTILHHKTTDRGREHRALKRGGGQVRGDSILIGTGSDAELMAFAQIAEASPGPELLVQMEEESLRLFARLGDEELRTIARQRLEGASAEEIAVTLDLSPRTVRRKLEIIRECWSHLVPD
jgi:DNA-directed RNA polymerase specialized sigma24 family protein